MMLITVFMLVGVTLSQGADGTSPGCAAPTADGCLINSFEKVADVLHKLAAFFCAVPDNVGNAFNVKEFMDLFYQLEELLGCAGCDINVLAGLKLDLEEVAKGLEPTAEKITPIVNELLGKLGLSQLAPKLLCTVGKVLDNPCIQDLLKNVTTKVTKELYNLICACENVPPIAQSIAGALGKLCGVTIDVEGISDADCGAMASLINNSLLSGLNGLLKTAGGLVDNLTNGGLCKLLGSGGFVTGILPLPAVPLPGVSGLV
ncbi:uncharacterized protein LOC134956781 [Pseudophryne corroboree]|uniref:uncharacterized protein LOC134956781 n=1 Tax=Pseudophryne corroboree TaxID=495146 RepID=UPI0030815EFD